MTEPKTIFCTIEILTKEISALTKVLQHQSEQSSAKMNQLEHYSIAEVAEIVHISQNSVRNIINDGELKIYKYKGTVRIRKIHLERFLNKHTS